MPTPDELRGYHPCGAPYKFEMLYFKTMAGPLRKWRPIPVPAVNWMMDREVVHGGVAAKNDK
ncbi:5-deoxy-glucuronate isomerase [Maritimibacter sp. DP4N28-5]|uniref:5-deoxy-glucuronate isomerase n=1 Tax=Maritimibacter dapengensis TaxID=2836868 RepID=A0ABS6T3Y6_9RHOB|nr:5-deoxy-glucuronate isomerase [Maritimibacter dapengensis]